MAAILWRHGWAHLNLQVDALVAVSLAVNGGYFLSELAILFSRHESLSQISIHVVSSCYSLTHRYTSIVVVVVFACLAVVLVVLVVVVVVVVVDLFFYTFECVIALRWRHSGRDSVSNHQPHDCLLNRLFRRRSKKTSKLRVTGLCVGNSPGTGDFPAQMVSNTENASIWWRHHVTIWNQNKMTAISQTIFQLYFLERKVLYFDLRVIEGSSWQQITIASNLHNCHRASHIREKRMGDFH